MRQGRRSGRTPGLGRPLRRALRRSGHSTLARQPHRNLSPALAWSSSTVISAPQSSMTIHPLQETASNRLDLLSSFSRSVSTIVTKFLNNHSDLLSCSQSLRSTFPQPSSTCYYEPFVFYGMQSTSIQESKACKKRNSTGSLRHGFVGKRSTSMKKSTPTTASFNRKNQCPEAPRNTTAFLIEDLEERELRDASPPSTSASPTNRARSSSSTSIDWCTDKLIPTCISDDQDVPECDDFEYMSGVVTRERLSTLSRDEINRELKTIEEQNRDLVNHFTKLRQENDTLRELLKANGIDPPQAIASNC